jgi:TPP-dependent pyruvate/acetoin dehydrogenase alpha subunit
LRQRLLDGSAVSARDLDEIEQEAKREAADAAAWAAEEPLPDPSELTTDVYGTDSSK